jgi:uncharacterized membrane protein YhaH (DUF805 family)
MNVSISRTCQILSATSNILRWFTTRTTNSITPDPQKLKQKGIRPMKRLFTLALCAALPLLFPIAVIAQRTANEPDPVAGAAGCMACSFIFIVLPIALFVINIIILVWVARDAKNRGMDSSVMWMILVFFTGPLGLIIYLFSRPTGGIVKCAACGNSKMEAIARCPHCGR